jgi:hypothetical protein
LWELDEISEIYCDWVVVASLAMVSRPWRLSSDQGISTEAILKIKYETLNNVSIGHPPDLFSVSQSKQQMAIWPFQPNGLVISLSDSKEFKYN